jgi:hypothetical protein
VRLTKTLRYLLLATFAVLLISGGVWWALDEFQRAGGHWLLALHGGAAMAAFMVMGAVLGYHAPLAWRRRVNRFSGGMLMLALGLLTVTAHLLYYSGSDILREQASLLHIIVGFALPIILAGHMVIGRMITQRLGYGETDAEP